MSARNLLSEAAIAREASAHLDNAPDVSLLYLAHARCALEEAKAEIARLESLIAAREAHLAARAAEAKNTAGDTFTKEPTS